MKPQTKPTDQISSAKVRIKVGSNVGQDLRYWRWGMSPDPDSSICHPILDLVFDGEWDGVKWRCTGPNYGQEGHYGNGAISAYGYGSVEIIAAEETSPFPGVTDWAKVFWNCQHVPIPPSQEAAFKKGMENMAKLCNEAVNSNTETLISQFLDYHKCDPANVELQYKMTPEGMAISVKMKKLEPKPGAQMYYVAEYRDRPGVAFASIADDPKYTSIIVHDLLGWVLDGAVIGRVDKDTMLAMFSRSA